MHYLSLLALMFALVSAPAFAQVSPEEFKADIEWAKKSSVPLYNPGECIQELQSELMLGGMLGVEPPEAVRDIADIFTLSGTYLAYSDAFHHAGDKEKAEYLFEKGEAAALLAEADCQAYQEKVNAEQGEGKAEPEPAIDKTDA